MIESLFVFLARIFRESGVQCILIGGYAVNSYRVTRHTADVDFMITREGFEQIKRLLEEAGYCVLAQQDVFVQLAGNGLRDLDFMLTDGDTFREMYASGNTTKIAGKEFIVPSLLHLIALKLHSIKYNSHRELNDLPDIVRLIQENSVDVSSTEVKEIFTKYGPEGILNKVALFCNSKGDVK